MSSSRTRSGFGVLAGLLALAVLVGVGLRAFVSDDDRPAAETSGSPTPQTSSSDGRGAPEPVVEGNQILDARDGSVLVPRGINWSSFEYACTQGWGYSALDVNGGSAAAEAEAAAMASWGANTIRLPVNQDCWLGTRGAPVSDSSTQRTAEGYRASIAEFIAALNREGLAVILDLQSRKRVDQNEFGNLAMPDAESLEFWESAAREYAGNPSVIFDAFNEPYSRYNNATASWALELSWECWRDGGCLAPVQDDRTEPLNGETYQAVGMARVVETIRAAGATQPIILGGLDYANDLRKWLDHAPRDPQLIAAIHSYPFKRCNNVACWDQEVASLATSVPVLTAEVGDRDHNAPYVDSYVSWAKQHNIGWLVWVWDGTADNPMALVQSDRATATKPYGFRVRELLQQF